MCEVQSVYTLNCIVYCIVYRYCTSVTVYCMLYTVTDNARIIPHLKKTGSKPVISCLFVKNETQSLDIFPGKTKYVLQVVLLKLKE